jgi:protein O-GlcNAc transferase
MPARNDPCPCGSGRRYKHCHGAGDATASTGPAQPPHDAAAPLDTPGTLEALRQVARLAPAEAAAARWQAVLDAAPGDAEALFNLGNAARRTGDFARAAAHYAAALATTPTHTGLRNNFGLVLEKLGRLEAAEAQFRAAVAHAPEGIEGLANLAQNLFQQQRHAEALPFFDLLVRRAPALAPAALHGNHGFCLVLAGRLAEADAALARARALDPALPALARNHGTLLVQRRDWPNAVHALARAVKGNPDDLYAQSALLHAMANDAQWDDDDAFARLAARMRDPQHDGMDVMAMDVVARSDDPALQRLVRRGSGAPIAPPGMRADPSKTRLRLGFVSSHFANHPVPRLLIGLLEALDRERFEVCTIATAAQPAGDPTYARIRAASDHHLEIGSGNAGAADAARVRDLDVDVLFDLNGYTGITLPALFAGRIAPMQVNFLGYTGTSASPAFDCLIADSYCIPDGMAHHYSERVLRVDPCYLPSDPARALGATAVRSRYGLADDAIVLAAFAAPYKIRASLFAGWMTLLHRHSRALLWLRPMPASTVANLRRHAESHGIAAERLRFAPEEPTADYLARFRLADLVLDTWPYGSHTTVNDALFAGAPVLALAGRTFAARASASQLAAMGLDALIAHDQDDYLGKADALIVDRAAREALQHVIASTATRAPLFDMQRYAAAFGRAIFAGWRALAGVQA